MIGIIGAMDIEVNILIEKLSGEAKKSISGIDFSSGFIGEREVVVAKCGIGKINAAMCAEAMILNYSPDIIINTGIAGSLSKDLSVLDVAVAKAVVEHDFDISFCGDPKGKVPGIETVEIPCDAAISLAIEGIVKQLGVKCVRGVIASGDQFICSEDKKDAIASCFSAVACEMEGGAIGHVCHLNNIPFAVIRAISDGANGAKMEYETFSGKAAELSSAIVYELVVGM